LRRQFDQRPSPGLTRLGTVGEAPQDSFYDATPGQTPIGAWASGFMWTRGRAFREDFSAHLAPQNANLDPVVEGPAISLAARYAKVRRKGYAK
jgi:hypothetical protein